MGEDVFKMGQVCGVSFFKEDLIIRKKGVIYVRSGFSEVNWVKEFELDGLVYGYRENLCMGIEKIRVYKINR